MDDRRCWVLTAGEAGMRNQAFGLAHAVGLPVEEKRATVRAPWRWLPGGLLPMPLSMIEPGGDTIRQPWPALVVACGRRAIDPALAIKRLSGRTTLAVYVQNPEFGREKFDLVAAMPHDGIFGANVLISESALHGITAERLAGAHEAWRSRLSADAKPLLGVLVGGDNGGYRLTAAVTERLLHLIGRAHDEHGLRIAVATSRRTGEAAARAINDTIRSSGAGTVWSDSDAYLGILASAERLLVTGDSISMISEALATGRPVHVLPIEGHGRRHDAFLKRMAEKRLASVVDGDDLDWSFASPGAVNATPAVAARLREMLAARQA
jgi:mitochondrial fission protein ELM1